MRAITNMRGRPVCRMLVRRARLGRGSSRVRRASQGSLPAMRRRYRDRMSDRVAIYPGSFDPPTNGHVDIVERSARLFDRVVVGVGRNLAKKTVFTADERIELMREACGAHKNVDVRGFDGLQVDFARACGASFIVRGI